MPVTIPPHSKEIQFPPGFTGAKERVVDLESWETLRKENLYLRELIDRLPLGYQSLDESGCLVEVNQTWLNLLGYTRQEVIGQNFANFLHPDWRSHFKENFPRFKSTGEILGVKFGMQKKDGSVVFVVLNGKIGKDSLGRFQQTYCAFQDITRQQQAEDALIRAEEKWRNFFFSVSQIGISLDPQGRIVFANRHFLRLVGWTEQEVIGRDWFDMFIPEHIRQEERKVFLTWIAQEDETVFQNYENQIITRTGEVRHVIWSNVLSKDTHNNIIDLTCLGVDLTERKLAEEKFQIAFNSAPIGIMLTDSHGVVIDCNNHLAAIFEASRENYIGLNLLTAIPQGPVRQNLSDALADGARHTYEGPYVSIFSGKSMELRISTEKAADDIFITLIMDITERKHMEKALFESEQRLRLFIEHAPAALAMFDRDMRYLSTSRRWLDDNGHGDRDLCGLSHYEVRDIPERWKEAHRRGLAGEVLKAHAESCELPNGSVGWKRWEIHPWYNISGDIGGIVIFTEDITAQKQAEERLRILNEELERRVEQRTRELQEKQLQCLHAEKLSAIGKLSASIAHEFNNPLQSILTILQGFRNLMALEEKDRVLLDLTISESHRMKNLIRSLQDFNRPSAGNKIIMDVHACIDSLLLLCKNDFKLKKISTVLNYAKRLPQILAIPDQIKQVFLNLLNNAADACLQNGGVITISTWKEDQRIAVAIKDTGTGIKPEQMSQIFQPFYSTKPEVKGTGLGLSICHGIVQNHRGEIRTESTLGEGSTFTVLLPIKGE